MRHNANGCAAAIYHVGELSEQSSTFVGMPALRPGRSTLLQLSNDCNINLSALFPTVATVPSHWRCAT